MLVVFVVVVVVFLASQPSDSGREVPGPDSLSETRHTREHPVFGGHQVQAVGKLHHC